MRLTTLLGTITALVVFAVIARAENDLDSLLGELTFGESQLVSEDNDEDLLTDDAAEELLPAPSAQADAEPQAAEVSELPINPGPPLPSEIPLPSEMPRDRMQNMPAPASPMPALVQPSTVIQPTQPMQPAPAITAPVPQHPSSHQQGCGCATCQQQVTGTPTTKTQTTMPAPVSFAAHSANDGSCQRDCDGACDATYECRPHRRPNLPPPSTMLQYFSSRNTNSNIWAGYAAEAQRRDDHYGKHANGQCDCHLKSKQKGCGLSFAPPPLYRAAVPPRCTGECDAGACTCGHH